MMRADEDSGAIGEVQLSRGHQRCERGGVCSPAGMNGQPESTQSMLGAGASDRTPKL